MSQASSAADFSSRRGAAAPGAVAAHICPADAVRWRGGMLLWRLTVVAECTGLNWFLTRL